MRSSSGLASGESGQRSSCGGSATRNFVIIEREDDLGGTWLVNHYPGLAVDVPTTAYSYSFEPNPNWSRLYSTGTEIKR
jgi:cation diffusion facilitator CzcD-associated flavoprotein CzcO